MAYRFAIYDQESVSAYTGNEVTPRFIPEQEVIELRVGDKFFLPGISSIWYTVLDIELGINSMIYSPCESENQVEFRMDLTEFSREYMNGGAINIEDQNVYLRPMGHAIPASPYIGGATHRNAIVGDIRAGDVGGGYAEERVQFDEDVLNYMRDKILNANNAEEKEPVELSKEVWCF